MEAAGEQDYLRNIDEFPCTFNLISAEKVTVNKLKAKLHLLVSEIDSEDDYQNELIMKKNMLSWIYFRLYKIEDAVKLSNEVIELTQWRNISSLGNRYMIMCHTGDELEAKKCLDILKKLSNETDFDKLLIEANAEHAYYYSRLGGTDNINRSIHLFSEAVEARPDNYMWKFGLGLAYRRATHANILFSGPQRVNVEEFTTKAIQYLFEVADNDDSSLQAMAYAELVTLRKYHSHKSYNAIFRNFRLLELCNKALEKGSDLPFVLTQCGNAMKFIDIDKSIALLEKSVAIKENSKAYHYLGKSFIRKVVMNMHSRNHPRQRPEKQSPIFETNSKSNHGNRDGRQESMSHDYEEHKQRKAISSYVRKHKNDLSLDKDDELVKKAIESFKKAIQLAKENFPAILDLGILLKDTGQIQEALIQFNTITNSHLGSNSKISLITAYEQAGLCYLELAKSSTSDNNYEEEGKKKLTKAVMYASDLIILTPELKDTQEFWTAFRTLDKDIDQKKYSGTQQREKIKLFDLAGKYGSILDVVKKLQEYTEEELDKEDIITIALKSYIKLGHIEDGLVFQNVVASRAAVRESVWWNNNPVRNMRIKILLLAIQKRLTEITYDNPTALFQKAFEILFGTCLGAHEIEVEGNQLDDGSNQSGDILVVFDADQDPEVCLTEKSALCLKQVATCLFGLQTEENLQGDGQYEIQLDEMRKYQVVLIILGNEPRDHKFEAMLQRVPRIKPNQQLPNQRILVIDAGLNVEIPRCLAPYECFKLQDIGGLGEVKRDHAPGSEEYQPSFSEILKNVFHGDVDAVLKLFSFIIGQQWPCPK